MVKPSPEGGVNQRPGDKKEEGDVLVARKQDGIKPKMHHFRGAASDLKADEKELQRAAGDFLRTLTLLGCQKDFRVFKFAVCPTSFHTLLPLPDSHCVFIGPKSTAHIRERWAELGHICRRRWC